MEFDSVRDLLLLAVALGTAIAAPFGILKGAIELTHVRHNRNREDFKFARDFINEAETNKQMHPYLKEKGYQTIAETTRIGAEEISYLLFPYTQEFGNELTADKAPNIAMRDYIAGIAYLQFQSEGSDPRVVFKEKYRKNIKVKILIWLYL